MIIQIYTAQSPEEALALVNAGVDQVGLTPPHGGLPGEISLAAMREIVDAVGERARCVALTVETDLMVIAEMVRVVQPAILHLCPLAEAITPMDVKALRALLPGVPIMQAVSVTGPESVAEARAYANVADYLILDTQAPGIPGIGASGVTHDWAVSRAIVDAVRIPVILAGGLTPENVADAVRAVRPWGVDSLTHTNQPLPGGGFCKDLAKVRAFAAAARAALP
ncbi:MAG TPA: phosphoribosylanthranilate isomerase [Candidatus Limnocylindrales bacterium]|nr:phosphoribosylanthranilate isomerase [Candidatus Limnocylindrales bacterium]